MSEFKKVLIVDDDPISLFVSKKTLELSKEFSTIKTIISPIEALQYLDEVFTNNDDEEIPGLLLIDINMPEMNGWEFIEQFNKISSEKSKSTIIHILSSSNNKDDLLKASRMTRVKDFYTKPLSIDHAKLISSRIN